MPPPVAFLRDARRRPAAKSGAGVDVGTTLDERLDEFAHVRAVAELPLVPSAGFVGILPNARTAEVRGQVQRRPAVVVSRIDFGTALYQQGGHLRRLVAGRYVQRPGGSDVGMEADAQQRLGHARAVAAGCLVQPQVEVLRVHAVEQLQDGVCRVAFDGSSEQTLQHLRVELASRRARLGRLPQMHENLRHALAFGNRRGSLAVLVLCVGVRAVFDERGGGVFVVVFKASSLVSFALAPEASKAATRSASCSATAAIRSGLT